MNKFTKKVFIALKFSKNISSDKNKSLFWNSLVIIQRSLPANIEVEFILLNHLEKDFNLLNFIFNPIKKFVNIKEYSKEEVNILTKNFEIYKKYIFFTKSIIKKLNCSTEYAFQLSNICSFLLEKNSQSDFYQLIFIDFENLNIKNLNSTFLYDNHLPINKIYFKYSKDIDKGYSVDFIIIPKNYISQFSTFSNFFLDSVTNKNKFLDNFTLLGWPNSSTKNIIDEFIFFINNLFKKNTIKLLDFIEESFLRKFLKIRLVNFFINKLRVFLYVPNLSNENSFVSKKRKKGKFSLKNVFLINPVMKYFINEKNLRNEIRFIQNNDFENFKGEYLIGKKDFILVLTKENSNNEELIKLKLDELRIKPFCVICIMKNKIILYRYLRNSNSFIKKILPKYSKTTYGNISRTILNIENKSIKNLPIILLNTLSYLEKCSDFAYLNTLIQFFIWEKINYVGLFKRNAKISYKLFPELFYYPKNNKIILENCLISFSFLDKFKNENFLNLKNYPQNSCLVSSNKNKLFFNN